MSAQCIVEVSYFCIINLKKLKRECLRNYCVRSGENLGFQFDKVSICLQKSIKKNIVSIFAKSNARHDCHALYRRTSFRWHVLLFVSLTSFLTSSLACTYDEKGLCIDKFLDDFTGLSARVHDEQVSLDLDKVSWRVLLLVCTTNKFYFCKFTVKFSLSALHTNKFQFLLESWHDRPLNKAPYHTHKQRKISKKESLVCMGLYRQTIRLCNDIMLSKLIKEFPTEWRMITFSSEFLNWYEIGISSN